ncbi:MarR family winged helix-turn-helix transcriptional regulator [Sutcliffiella halmapala]|uniref:MarR family winged helix-turn-helix transcriptional regulator n=1 Tax=Sutcliffiella halmapala TaxID=79882 RepID=UPI0009959F56|nr:MarR family transcriptional regulator [Sutcliffiella halmapala]
MSENQKMKLEDMLCFTIYASSREITRLYRPVLSQFNLTYPQYLALVVLWEKEKCTVTELGDRLLLDSATLTPLLKRLEASELITRKRSLGDERKVEITLTKKGEELQADVEEVSLKIFTELCQTEENYYKLMDINKNLLDKAHEIARKVR